MSEYPESSIPKDSEDHYVHVGDVSSDTRERLRRLVSVFITLSDEEQELVTQEIEQDCR